VPRIPRSRLVAENTVNHCTWRCHGFRFLLEGDEEKAYFRALLLKFKDRFGIVINNYCIMDSHPHVQTRATRGLKAFSEFWKMVNWSYACWYNERHESRGQVVMDRMSSPQVQDGAHQLRVMRYGDLNPVRAKLVRSPKDWKWSSYRHYAFGEKDPLITDAPEYLALGRTPAERQQAYVHLFAAAIADELHERRPEFVRGPFIGEHGWIVARRLAVGLTAPS
jgi:putative transposase